MSKFLATAAVLFLLIAALAVAVDRDLLAAVACVFAGGLTLAVALAAYGVEITYDLEGEHGTSVGGGRPIPRPWWTEKRWRVAAIGFWLAFPFAYPLSRGPAAYLVAAGVLNPVAEAAIYYPIAAARRQRWLPEWYTSYVFECGKSGQRAAAARASRTVVDADSD